MKLKELWKKGWVYIVAFMIPICLVLIHCAIHQVWMFGDRVLLRGDARLQYIFIFEELWNQLHEGNLSYYSWNAMGGFDFLLNVLYYAVSPTTIIVMLLPKACMEDALQFFMVTRWALLSVTATYFFLHTNMNRLKHNRKLVSLALGLCFAMSSSVLALLQFFNWLDTLVLFPLLLLLIEYMIREGKWKAYFWTLLGAILCNFYIAFPICIFLCFWTILQLQISSSNRIQKFFQFLGVSCLSGCCAMAIILPCALNVSGRYSAYGTKSMIKDYITSIRTSVTDFVARFFTFSFIENVQGEMKIVCYASIGIIVLALMYCFIRMNRREKWTKIIITTIIIASMFLGALNFVWHAFAIPHGLDVRYGFILVMMLMLIALDVLRYIHRLKVQHVAVSAFIGVALFLYVFFTTTQYDEFYVYLTTVMLYVLVFVIVILYMRKSLTKKHFVTVFACICILDISANAYYQLSAYDKNASHVAVYLEEIIEMTEELNVEAGKRVAICDAGKEPGLATNLPCMNGFVSYCNGATVEMMGNLGMPFGNDASCEYFGGSPLLNFMFNIEKGIGSSEAQFSDADKIVSGENASIYEIQRPSSLGYMVNETITNWNYFDNMLFDAQNAYVQKAMNCETVELFQDVIPEDWAAQTTLGIISPNVYEGGLAEFVYEAQLKEDVIVVHFTVPKDMDLYMYMQMNNLYCAACAVDQEVIYRNMWPYKSQTIHVGNVQKGQQITTAFYFDGSSREMISLLMKLEEFDEEAYNAVYKELASQMYSISEMSNDYIKGEIIADEDGIMMTSINASKGFTVLVDGVEVKYEAIGDALIGVPLKMGEHTVEFIYQTPYVKVGLLISLCSLLLYVIIIVIEKKYMLKE